MPGARSAEAHTPANRFCIAVVALAGGHFSAALADSTLLVRSSRQPFVGAARELLRRGADPDTNLTVMHSGSATVALRAQVGTAAGLTVDETGRPRFRRWKAYCPRGVAPPIEPAGEGGTVGQADGEALP